ncbi:hypothetical protein [Streptomyces abikoensis]|uniref:Uncharacterized protein n=2 Tax=Streptomyces TaxID=1883 RepID=A0ABW7T8Q1_9ACTN
MVHDIQEPLRDWSRLSTQVIHRSSHLTLHHDRVLQPDGSEGTYDRLTIADGARTVAVDARRRVALVEDAF